MTIADDKSDVGYHAEDNDSEFSDYQSLEDKMSIFIRRMQVMMIALLLVLRIPMVLHI